MFSRIFLKHLFFACIVLLILGFFLMKFLNIYTLHGKTLTVPDYTGLSMDELTTYNQNRNFRFEVIDSIYDNSHEKGTIIAQDPLPESKVKPNRKIYLTLVATQPEQVSMPDLVDLTLRQARAVLETYNLSIDSLTYVPDIAKNAVLDQIFQGQKILPGTMIKKGSKIDLVLGQGLGDEKISVPFLIGKKQEQAIKALHEVALNVGVEIFEDGDDTAHARVYMQKPSPAKNNFLSLGQSVDLWYRSDFKFDFKEYIQNYIPDTSTNEMETEQ